MAARTGASIGVVVAITILGLLAFSFFVVSMVFFAQAQDANQRAADAADAAKTFIRDKEREQESVRVVRQQAERERQSVVAYLIGEQRQLMQAVAGDPDATRADVETELGAAEGGEGQSMLGLLNLRNEQISTLDVELASAIDARDNAVARAEEEAKRAGELADEFGVAGDELSGKVHSFASDIEESRSQYEQLEGRLRDEIDQSASDYEQRIGELNGRISELIERNLVQSDQIRRLQGEGASDRVRGQSEEALVDGTVDRVDDVANEVILSIGRNQKVILGMTFAVYDDATNIRIDSASGDYAAGKGAVEVIRVEENFCRARVVRASRGNPIVRGDIIANAVYDPNKTYQFVIYGLFDRNLDGKKTAYERDDLAGLISRWGGRVVEQIEGDIDFVVLGEKPKLPPPPGPDATQDQINHYIRLQNIIQRYDTMLEEARATSLPVLNENRLRTLIGDYPD